MILIPLMALLSRSCGASWKPRGAEWMFAVPFAAVSYTLFGWWGILGLVTTYLGMQLGHGNFYHMEGVSNPDKPEALEWLARKLWSDINSPFYSWLCFGIKGALIGLAVFPYGLALIPLWPLAYYLSWKYWNATAPAEWLAGGFAGLVLWWSL